VKSVNSNILVSGLLVLTVTLIAGKYSAAAELWTQPMDGASPRPFPTSTPIYKTQTHFSSPSSSRILGRRRSLSFLNRHDEFTKEKDKWVAK